MSSKLNLLLKSSPAIVDTGDRSYAVIGADGETGVPVVTSVGPQKVSEVDLKLMSMISPVCETELATVKLPNGDLMQVATGKFVAYNHELLIGSGE